MSRIAYFFFFFQAEDGIRDYKVTGVQTCALPIYDRARDVPDVVLVEDQQRPEPGAGQGLANAAQAVPVQAAEVHALLEVHLRVARRLEGPVPRVSRVDGLGRHAARLGRVSLLRHWNSPEHAFCGRRLL